jgi:restriction endonuclease S subunit
VKYSDIRLNVSDPPGNAKSIFTCNQMKNKIKKSVSGGTKRPQLGKSDYYE